MADDPNGNGAPDPVVESVEQFREARSGSKPARKVQRRRGNSAKRAGVRGRKNRSGTAAGAAAVASGANKTRGKKRGRPSNAERAAREESRRDPVSPESTETRILKHVEAIYGHLLNLSNSEKRDLIALQARVHAQQQTIDVLERQLQIAQANHELLLQRVIGGIGAAPALGPAVGPPQIARAPRHQIAFGPPPIEDGPGLPMPVQHAKGQNAPTPADLAQTYVGEGGQHLFEDIGDDEANRHGLVHDEITGIVQQGKRQPVQ